MTDSSLKIRGDWTYEKSWQSPEDTMITYEELVNRNDPSEGVQEATKTFRDHQYAEIWTQYKTFSYVDENNENKTQDLVVKRVRHTYISRVALCANFFKWVLESPKRGGNIPSNILTNAQALRVETTVYEYELAEDGWTQSTEQTLITVSGFEFLGSLPIKEFGPFLTQRGRDLTGATYNASYVYKTYYANNIARDTDTHSRKRMFSRVSTYNKTMYAFTQEGQQYVQELLKKESAANQTATNASYWRTFKAWESGSKLTSDGSTVNSSIGRLTIEEKPNDYDDAESDLDEDDSEDDDADSANGQSDNQQDDQDGTPPGRIYVGQPVDLQGGDLDDRWRSWTPYDEAAGSQIKDTSDVWEGDPLNSADSKPKFYIHIGDSHERPDQKGLICFDTSDPRDVSEISMSRVSVDGFWTADFVPGQRIMVNSFMGGCVWWYLIRKVSKDGESAKVKFIDDILDTVWEEMICSELNEGWTVKAIVTCQNDRGDRVFQMPFAPDDFMMCKGGDFVIVPGNATQAAGRYVKVQKRLLDGQDKGINVTTSLRQIPSAPFSDIYLNMLGTSIYGRTNGTSWAFNESGCVVSTDIIYGGHAGRDGSESGLRTRAAIVEAARECPIKQSEGWVEPPDGMTIDQLPVIYPDYAEPDTVRKTDTIEVDDDFSPDNPSCSFWTDELPLGMYDEVAAETVTTDHVFVQQDQPYLTGRVRVRAKVAVIDGAVAEQGELIQLFVRNLGYSDPFTTDYKPEATYTRTMTYSIVKGWQPGSDDPDNPDPPGPVGPDLDCTLRVQTGFGLSNEGGMYLGLTDGGNRYPLSSLDGNDPMAIRSHPNFWQFEQGPCTPNCEIGAPESLGFNLADWIYPPKKLLSPLVINGKDYNYLWITTSGTLFFTEKDAEGSMEDGILPNSYNMFDAPGFYGCPSICINTASVCAEFFAFRESKNSQTVRYQACSYDNFFDREGKASIIWEFTIYKRDPAIDQPLQLMELKSAMWDQADDSWIDGSSFQLSGSLPWAPKVILCDDSIGSHLVEFEMPPHTNDDPISWVFSSNLEGTNWQAQSDRHIKSECSFIPKCTTIAMGHAVISADAIKRKEVVVTHTAYPVGSYNIRIATDIVEFSVFDDFQTPLWSPGKLQGIYPSLYIALKPDGGLIMDHVCNSGQPYMTPGKWPDTDGMCNGLIQARDITPNGWPYADSMTFTGADKTDREDWQTNPVVKIGYDRLGHDFYSTNMQYASESIPTLLVWHGSSPRWVLDGIDKNGIGAPYRRSIGLNHTILFQIANRGEVAQWEVYPPTYNYDGTPTGQIDNEGSFVYPKPEKVCPDTGTYLWNAPTTHNPDDPVGGWTHPDLDWAQYLLNYAWPMRHKQGRKPTWAIYGWHFKKYTGSWSDPDEDMRIVYFNTDYGDLYTESGVTYQPREPYMAWEYMTTRWTEGDGNVGLDNRHTFYWMDGCPIWVDEECIYLKAVGEQEWNGNPNQQKPHPWPEGMNYTGLNTRAGNLDAGYSIIAFFDDPKSCVTRYVQIPEVGDVMEVITGWRPDIAFCWPVGRDQGYQVHYKSIIFSPQKGYGSCEPESENIEQGYYGNDTSEWVICQQMGNRWNTWDQAPGAKDRFISDYQANFAYKITDTGFIFTRLRHFDMDEYAAEGTESGRDLRMFVCLQRQQPVPNSTVGQFFVNEGLADFTYSAAALGHGEFKIDGQELLKMDGALPYPPFELDGTLFFGGGQQIDSTYLRWLRLKAEVGEVELDTAAPSYTRLIFCCYPDLDATGAQEFHLEGFEADYSLVFHLDAAAWPGQIEGQEIGFTYIRNLFFQVQPGEFESGGESVIFNYRRGMRLVGDIFRVRGWDAQLLERGRMLNAETGRFELEGGRTGGPRVHLPLTAGAGAFLAAGGDSKGVQGNSFYGTFNLQGQEIGGSVTQSVPLLLECGNFQSEGFNAESEVIIPSDFPRQTLVAWHEEYTGTGHGATDTQAVTISGVPFSPAFVWSIPAEFPLAIRDRTFELAPNRDLYGWPAWSTNSSYMAPTNEGNYMNAGFGDWMFNRVVGRAYPMQTFENGMRYGQPSILKSWTADGIELGRGEEWLGDVNYHWSIGDDHNAFYNFVTGDSEDQLPDAETRNFPLKYTLFFLRLNHPETEGEDSSPYTPYQPDNSDDWENEHPYTILHKESFPPHALGNWGIPEYGLIPAEMLFNSYDPDDPNNNYAPWDSWYRRWDTQPGEVKRRFSRQELNAALMFMDREAAFNYVWDQIKRDNPYETHGPTSWGTQEPFEEIADTAAGRYWVCTDQEHKGIAMGALCPPYEQFNYYNSKLEYDDYWDEWRAIEEERYRANQWYRVPTGLDETPDLLMLIPVGCQESSQNSPSWSGWMGLYNTMCWFVPSWGQGRGVRCIGADQPSTVFDNDNQTGYDDAATTYQMPGYDSWADDVWMGTLRQMFWDFDGDGIILPGSSPQSRRSLYAEDDPSIQQAVMSWIAIKNTPGYVMTGSYSGDGTDALWVSCSFRPGFVLAKATSAPCTGMFIHMRPVDPRVDGQSEYTLLQGTPQYDTTTGEPVEPEVGWQPRAKGPDSLFFQKGGFYVPAGAIGNDADHPGQTVTFVAFAVEHWRIQHCAGEPGTIEVQGQEIGGKILQRVERCEAGSFAVNPGQSFARITRHNPDPTIGTSSVGGFWLRGMDGNPVLSAPAGNFTFAGHAELNRPIQRLKAGSGNFGFRGNELIMCGPLAAQAGNFRATLQWVGGNYGECRQIGANAPQTLAPALGGITVSGDVPLVGGTMTPSECRDAGWIVHQDGYRDDGTWEIVFPEGLELTIAGHTCQRLWASSNGLFTFESGDSTYSISNTRPSQNKLMLQGGDRCTFGVCEVDAGDGSFIIRNYWGASYSTNTIAAICEVTLFKGYPNIIQVNWEIQNISGTYFGVWDATHCITDVNNQAQPNTTYVFESEDGGANWVRHDNQHFIGGPIIRNLCLYPEVHEMQLIGGDLAMVKPTYRFRVGTGTYSVQGRIP